MNADLRVFPHSGTVIVTLANVDPTVANRRAEFYLNRMPLDRRIAADAAKKTVRDVALRPCQCRVAGKLFDLLVSQNSWSNTVAAHFQIGVGLALAGKTVPAPKTLRKRAYAKNMALGCKRGGCVWGQFHRRCIGNARGKIKTQ